jgi:hypothetical protein
MDDDDPLEAIPGAARERVREYLDRFPEYEERHHRTVRLGLAAGFPGERIGADTMDGVRHTARLFEHPASAAAWVDWHAERLPTWLATPLTEEQ